MATCLLLLTIAAPVLRAQTWDGGSTNNNWTSANNWNPNGIPVNNGTANLIFSGNTRTTTNQDFPFNVNSVTFDSAAGSFVLQGSNPLTIQGGGILSDATVAETINNGIILGANQAWTVTNSGTSLTANGIVSGAFSLEKAGSGTLILSGNNIYSGGTTVSGGILQGTTTSLKGPINNNANVTFNQSFNATYSGDMSGTGTLTKEGTGTVTLSGTNSYLGGTNVNAGSLTGTTTSLQGNITNNANVTFSQTTSGSYSGQMGGSGGLTKSGSGTVILGGDNSYTGGTTVTAGTLQIGVNGALPTGQAVTVGGGILDLNGFSETVSSISGTGGLSLGSATLTVDGSASTTFGGVISGAGSLIKSGSSTLVLGGNNTYSGGTTVNGGTLQGNATNLKGTIVNNATVNFNQIGNGTYSGVMSGNGSLVKEGAGTLILSGNNTYGGGTTVNGGVLNGTTTTLQGNINNNANVTFSQSGTGTYAGTISGSGSVTKTSSGTVILGAANSYSGGTTVSSGTLRAGVNGALPGGQAVTIDGGTLDLNGFNQTVSSLSGAGGSVSLGAATMTVNGAVSASYAGGINGAGALLKSGSSNLTLSGSNSYTGGTTVNAGSLTGTSTSLQGAIVNNATVNFDQSTNGTYSGAMSGTGALVKNGAGTLTLSGSNIYSGGTTVNGGSLVGTTDSLQGAITNDANVTFNQSGNGSYAGAMSGTGVLVKNGTGTVTLTGPNSYGGGTIVSGGILQGTSSSLQGDITNDANVTFDQNTSGTFAGTMGGSGALVKNGTGTVTLSGPNAYSGGTIVGGGVLQGTTSSLQGDITNDANVAFDQSADGTYSGSMSGSGNLTKSGAGALTMSGVNSYTGATNVDAGKLILNGSLSSDTTIASGASLGGNGTIGGDLINSGTVGAGNSIGTLTVSGTYTQQAGSVLEVEINDGGTTPGVNNDLIQADSVALNGGTVSVLADAGTYVGGSQYRFLSSTTAITGQFDAITINPSAYSVNLGYDFDAGLYWAYFTFASDFNTFAETGNQRAVAEYLDAVSPGASGDLNTILTGLDGLAGDPAAMRGAFDSLTGQIDPTLAAIGLQNTTLVVQQLAGQLRTGSLGISSGGTAFSEPKVGSLSGPVMLVSYNQDGAPQVTFVSDEDCDPWTGWTMGYGLGGSAASDGNAAGLTYGMGGTLLGLDRSLGAEGRLGFFGGYQGTNLRLSDLSQNGLINGGMLGNYLYHDDGFNYYSAISGLQFNGFETTRHTTFAGIDRTASGNFSGWQGYGYLERGVTLRGNRAKLQPYAALQYIYLRQNGYTETGADSLNLAYSGIDANSLRSLVGSRVQTTYESSGGHLLHPELRALWLHEFLATDVAVNSLFAPIGGSSFAVDGLNLGRDWAILGAGLRYDLPSGWQIVANYDAQVNTQQVFHVGSGSLQYAW